MKDSDINMKAKKIRHIRSKLFLWYKKKNVRSLAQADINNVLKVWEGMGYYAPARNLYQAAKTVVEKHDGKYSLEGFEIASKQLMVGWSGIY